MLSIARLPTFVVLTLVVFGGPVAACICVEDMNMAAMPCCPDQPVESEHSDSGLLPELAVSCVPLPNEGLLVEAVKPSTPVAILPASVPDRRGLDPPWQTAGTASRPFEGGSPLYLTTRRLRI